MDTPEDSNSDSYREKYRRSIEEQDLLEKQYAAQVSLLRGVLINVSDTSRGLTQSLDQAIDAMRVSFRGGSGEEIVQCLEQLNEAASQFEAGRPGRKAKVADDVQAIIQRLQALKLPPQVQRGLKSFTKGLEDRVALLGSLPFVIEELGKLQAQALDAAENPEESLWQRLKGGKTLNSDSSSEEQVPASEASSQSPEKTDDAVPGESDTEQPAARKNSDPAPDTVETAATEEIDASQDGVLENADVDTQAPVSADQQQWPDLGDVQLIQVDEDQVAASNRGMDPGSRHSPAALQARTEADYKEVAGRIAVTLDGLVDKIEPNELVQHKIESVKLRIKSGMDWYTLAITLEDLRDILLLRYLQTDKDFSEYLKQVNLQLQLIREALGTASRQEAALNQSANMFSESVSRQIDLMHNSIHSADDLGTLKAEVSSNLNDIKGALSDFKQAQEKNAPLSEQLISLVNKVQSIEKESEKTKELLEEERYKATHDPLTALPNREAYNERALQELKRFQRYERPLTMVVADIDKFKNINDTYGHQAGDKVIKVVAKLLSSKIREVDFVGRYGGEEFVMLLPETAAEKAVIVLDKIRAYMANTPFRFKDEPVQITISMGLADFSQGDTIEAVFDRADKALYVAKNSGRNRCSVYDAATCEKPDDGTPS